MYLLHICSLKERTRQVATTLEKGNNIWFIVRILITDIGNYPQFSFLLISFCGGGGGKSVSISVCLTVI